MSLDICSFRTLKECIHLKNSFVYLPFSSIVPNPDNVTVTADDTQIVGQSLILVCSGIGVRGVTSSVDIVWSSNGEVLNRIIGISGIFNQINVPLYTATHVLQLNTDDEDRTYQCEIIINSDLLAMSADNMTLNVTGNYIMNTLCDY